MIARATNGVWSEWSEGNFTVDNTPVVTVNSPGPVNAEFTITGTATLKRSGGYLWVYIDGKDWGGNGFGYCYLPEGQTSWRLSDFGQRLYLWMFGKGIHRIYVIARATNGTWSQWCEGSFEVTSLDRAKNLGTSDGTCETRTFAGNPINFATGNKYQKESDLNLGGPGLPLSYSRYHNSQSTLNTSVGSGSNSWSFNDYIVTDAGKIILHQADGAEVHFIDNGQGKYISETDKVRAIEPVTGGYNLKEPDGRVFSFDGGGKLLRITDRNGNTQTLSYSSGRLSSVEDNFGRRLEFAYGADNKLATLTTPIGSFAYTYDGQGNLTMVTRPDQTTRTYLYEDPNDPTISQGLSTRKGSAPLTVQYDNQDRGILSEGAGGSKRVTIAYDDNFISRVTDSLGRTTTFKLHVEKGIAQSQRGVR